MAENSAAGGGSHPQAAPAAEMTVVSEGHASGDKPPSKSAIKKAQKEKEKKEKAAKRAEEERKQKEASAASDTAKGLYGKFEGGIIPESEEAKVYPLADLNEELVGQQVVVEADVHNSRVQSAKLAFLDLRQNYDVVQAVIAETVLAEDQQGKVAAVSRQMVKWCGNLNRESLVYVTALVQKPKEPIHSSTIPGIELHVQKCFIIASGPQQLSMQIRDAEGPVPLGDDNEVEGQADEQGRPLVILSTRLNNRTLDLRTPINKAIFRINGEIEELFNQFMRANKFEKFHTPKIVGTATEGGSNVFEIKYFDRPAYLGQSPQFYKQMLIAAQRTGVYEVGPVFRAENSNTARHLTEFTGLDFEMRIRKSWLEVVDTAEAMILYIFSRIPTHCAAELDVIQRAYPDAGNFQLPSGRAPRISFAEGVQMLREAGFDAAEDEDISTTNEKELGALIRKKYNSDFFVMTHYPIAARPFYTHPTPGAPHLTNSYDAFMRGQEIVSGAQRIHDPDELAKSMRSKGLDPDADGFRDYVKAFRDGCAPHGGAGFGLNRLTMLYLGLPNIRLATLFPRDPGRVAP